MATVFGQLTNEQNALLDAAFAHPQTLYCAKFDNKALWDPATIDKIIDAFPKNLVDESELFLVLAECIANAVLHGQAQALGFHARRRADVILLSFFQIPPMQQRVGVVLSLAQSGRVRECLTEIPGGLGFPILTKLAHRITISGDSNRLQLWFRPSPAQEAQD